MNRNSKTEDVTGNQPPIGGGLHISKMCIKCGAKFHLGGGYWRGMAACEQHKTKPKVVAD